MAKKRKERVKRPRYRAKSPKHAHVPRTCACGERVRRVKVFVGLQGAGMAWQCPKCGITEGPAAGLVGGFDVQTFGKKEVKG